VFFAGDADAGEITFDNESGDVFAIDFGHNEEEVGPFSVADPHFCAVEHIVVAFILGAGGHAESIGARIGLAEGVGSDPLAAREEWQIFVPLFVGAKRGESELGDSAGYSDGDAE